MNGGRSKIGPSSTRLSPTWLADSVCITYWASKPAVTQRTSPIRSSRGTSATTTGSSGSHPQMGRSLAMRSLLMWKGMNGITT